MRPRSPNVLPFFLPVIGLVALRSPASTVTIRLMESLPLLNVSAGAGDAERIDCARRFNVSTGQSHDTCPS